MMEQIPTKIYFPEFILQNKRDIRTSRQLSFPVQGARISNMRSTFWSSIFKPSYIAIHSSCIQFILLLAVYVLYLCRLIAESSYCLNVVLEDLACLFPAATLLHALPLHVSLFKLLHKGVCSFRAGQNLCGCLFAQENCWRRSEMMQSVDLKNMKMLQCIQENVLTALKCFTRETRERLWFGRGLLAQ